MIVDNRECQEMIFRDYPLLIKLALEKALAYHNVKVVREGLILSEYLVESRFCKKYLAKSDDLCLWMIENLVFNLTSSRLLIFDSEVALKSIRLLKKLFEMSPSQVS